MFLFYNLTCFPDFKGGRNESWNQPSYQGDSGQCCSGWYQCLFSCASGENGGRIYGIQGINGSGKTMLMRVICGLVLPTMGTVSIDGEIIGKGISFPRSIGLCWRTQSLSMNSLAQKSFSSLWYQTTCFASADWRYVASCRTEPIRQKALPQIFSRHEAAPWNRSRYRWITWSDSVGRAI